MSIKKVCDRCNKVKEGNESFAHIDYMVGNDHSILDYDLCPECAKLFEMFINGGTVEEQKIELCLDDTSYGKYEDENHPEPQVDTQPKKNHCGTCAYQWSTTECPRAKETPGTISCSDIAECCDKWEPSVDFKKWKENE